MTHAEWMSLGEHVWGVCAVLGIATEKSPWLWGLWAGSVMFILHLFHGKHK